MTITIQITLNETDNEELEMDIDALPGEKMTESEQEVATEIIVICDLLDDDNFNEKLGDFIDSEMSKDRFGHKKGLIM